MRKSENLIGLREEELETPVIVVDLDRLDLNLAAMAAYATKRGIGLWPHTKTHKCIALAKRQLALGAEGLTVAKTEEAEIMTAAGGGRILVAYPPWGEAKWRRLAILARENEITVALDSLETARGLANEAARIRVNINVLIDLDVGLRRTGVPTPTAALKLAQQLGRLNGLRVRGLFFYPGHVWVSPARQDNALRECSASVEETLELFDRDGIDRQRVSGGSTPTAKARHQIFGQTESRPGAYVFYDRNYVGIDVCTLADCALTVLTTVVSASVPGRAMVDAGSKTMSADPWLSGDGQGFGWIVGRSPEIGFTELSEEHGHLDLATGAKPLRVGDRLRIIPNHVCPVVNLHDFYVGVRRGLVEAIFTSNGRGCTR